jgi:alkylation response protein AidB-like acyl-CoA dehydrogenase
MPLAITEDHRALAEVAGAMVAGRAGTAGARRILLDRENSGRWWSNDGLWKEMVSTGWLGLHVDERFDGQGYGLPELTMVLEQLGQAALGVAVSAVIAEAGSDDQRELWLPRPVSGDLIAGIGTKGNAVVHDSTVSAAAVPALAEAGADLFLLPAGDDLVLVQAGDGISTRTVHSVDQLLAPVVVVNLSAAPVAEIFPGAAGIARRILRLLAAAEAVGGLGAVKHHCANMLLDTELAVAATWDAARADGTEADLAATMAAGHALTAYQRVALQNVQVHGGIGYTWEHDAHLYIRRATVLQAVAGDQDTLRDNVIALQRDGVRRRQSVDLPEGAEQYRQAALDFRSELEAADADDHQRLWARSGYLQPHWPAPYGRAADSVAAVTTPGNGSIRRWNAAGTPVAPCTSKKSAVTARSSATSLCARLLFPAGRRRMSSGSSNLRSSRACGSTPSSTPIPPTSESDKTSSYASSSSAKAVIAYPIRHQVKAGSSRWAEWTVASPSSPELARARGGHTLSG